MSHNNEPERTPSRHMPVIAALIFVLGVVVIAFLVFTPGADTQPYGVQSVDVEAVIPEGMELDAPNIKFPEDANTPASGHPGPIGTADLPAGAEPFAPGAPETPALEPAPDL